MEDSRGPKAILSEVAVGSTLQSTTLAEIVTTVKCSRACAIEIRNYHQDIELRDPSHFLYSGINQNPPPSVIKPGYAEACLYRKVYGALRGSVGVLVYKIDKVIQDEKKCEIISRVHDGDTLALMWYIPFAGANWHAIGINKNANANMELYKEMEVGTPHWFSREISGVCARYEKTIGEIKVKVAATMSDPGTASWIINIQ